MSGPVKPMSSLRRREFAALEGEEMSVNIEGFAAVTALTSTPKGQEALLKAPMQRGSRSWWSYQWQRWLPLGLMIMSAILEPGIPAKRRHSDRRCSVRRLQPRRSLPVTFYKSVTNYRRSPITACESHLRYSKREPPFFGFD